MLGKSKRIMVAGAAAIGAALTGAARQAGEVIGITPRFPRVNENGLPMSDRIGRTGKARVSVAQTKRNALKARNRAKNRAAHQGAR